MPSSVPFWVIKSSLSPLGKPHAIVTLTGISLDGRDPSISLNDDPIFEQYLINLRNVCIPSETAITCSPAAIRMTRTICFPSSPVIVAFPSTSNGLSKKITLQTSHAPFLQRQSQPSLPSSTDSTISNPLLNQIFFHFITFLTDDARDDEQSIFR